MFKLASVPDETLKLNRAYERYFQKGLGCPFVNYQTRLPFQKRPKADRWSQSQIEIDRIISKYSD